MVREWRSLVLFGVGFFGVAYETTLAATPDYATLGVLLGMMGLPSLLRDDTVGRTPVGRITRQVLWSPEKLARVEHEVGLDVVHDDHCIRCAAQHPEMQLAASDWLDEEGIDMRDPRYVQSHDRDMFPL